MNPVKWLGAWWSEYQARRKRLCVEIFFGIITRQAIRRGTFTSIGELHDAIRDSIDAYNDRAEPFTWTKNADTIVTKISRKPTSNTRH